MSQSPNRVLVYADTTDEPVVVGSLILDSAIRRPLVLASVSS
jgi:hypothetical protein